MNQKISMIKFIKVWGIILLISLAVIFMSYKIYDLYQNFNSHAAEIRKDYTLQQKNIIQKEVMHVVDRIEYSLPKLATDQEKKELLQKISEIRFGKEGYIFVNKYNGDALVANGEILSGRKKLWKVFPKNEDTIKEIFQKERYAATKKGGDFIYYSFVKLLESEKEAAKVSFIYGLPDLQWIVGAGVYLDDVENNIAVMKDKLGSNVKVDIFYSVLIVIFIIALYLLLFNIQLRKLENDLNQFNSFFKNAATKNEFIELNSIKFMKFAEMAKNANNMLKDKILAQNELFREKEKLFVTIRSVGDGLITTDKKGNVDLMNEISEKLTGWSNEEAKGKPLTEIFNIINEKTKKQIENPAGRVLTENKIIGLSNHTILISKNGTEYNIADSAAPIKDAENNVQGVVLVFRDVTEKYKIEKRLRENEKKFRNIFENHSAVKLIIDPDAGNIVDANNAAAEFYGWSVDELKSMKISQINTLPTEDVQKVMNKIKNNEQKYFEFKHRKSDGKLIDVEVYSSLINIGNKSFLYAIIHDVSEKKKIMNELVLSKEKAVNADKLKSIFLSQMSHEIRTPISAMMSLSSLLRDDLADKITDDDKLSFDLIARAGMRIVRTVDLILNLSEIQAGTYQVINKSFNLYSDILEKIIDEYKKLAQDKGILLKVDLSTNNTEIVADSYTVGQIFTQLIDNAIKYTDDGKIDIIVYRNENGKLATEISDTGIGIAKEYLADLFTPFTQEEMGYTRKYEGNGIGLTLVKKYCELNNANIEVKSEKGIGTKFIVNFI